MSRNFANVFFLLALIILFFAVVVLDADITGLFSREFRDAPWSLAKVWDLFKHLWIPGLISAITGSAGLIRIMRANLLDTLGQPFVEAARARGLKNRVVIWKHAVSNGLIPIVTIRVVVRFIPGTVEPDSGKAT